VLQGLALQEETVWRLQSARGWSSQPVWRAKSTLIQLALSLEALADTGDYSGVAYVIEAQVISAFAVTDVGINIGEPPIQAE